MPDPERTDPELLQRILKPQTTQDLVVARPLALNVGLSDRDLLKLQFRGWHRVARGVRITKPAREATVLELAAATSRLSGGRAVASHLTAALIHGFEVVTGMPGVRDGQPTDLHMHVTVSTPNGVRYPPDVKVHRTNLERREVMLIESVPVTTPARTAADLLLTQPRTLAIAALEQGLQKGILALDDLVLLPGMMRCRPGAQRGKDWLTLVTPGTGSPLETLSRLKFAEFGLIPSRIQPVILDERGRFVARSDFEFTNGDRKVLGEADGRSIHDLPEARYADREREDALRQLGYEVVRWVWSDVINDLEALVVRIRRWL